MKMKISNEILKKHDSCMNTNLFKNIISAFTILALRRLQDGITVDIKKAFNTQHPMCKS